MVRLPVIPCPDFVEYLGGEVQITPDFPLTITENAEGFDPEGYELKISSDGVSIRAARGAGIFYAEQTLKQLKVMGRVPCVLIKDEPAFRYRGIMLDSVRHFTELEGIKKLIDAAAMFQLIVFHLHMTDDQGWRNQTLAWQRLTEIGSKRPASEFGNENDMRKYGGYYTKQQMREIVDYCSKRHIEVVPEIDMPGHTRAILACYPELSCTGEQLSVGTKQGIYSDILCAGNDKVFDLVFDVLSEVMEIFPSKRIHIGGDEAPKKRWRECPKCQKRMKEQGLNNEEELQGWFVNRIVDFLAEHGRQAIAWNESLKSGLIKDNVVIQYWMDKKGLSQAFANNGGSIIISDFYKYYLDYPYGMTPLKKTYNFNPLIEGLNEQGKKNIFGIEATIWTEYMCDFNKLCHMTFPRAAAVAQTGWAKRGSMDCESFIEKFKALTPILKDLGITPAPESEWNPSVFSRVGTVVKFFSNALNWDMIRGRQ
ncbi:MAG: beta-N-acetylhexosaminidase [Clostridiales bacterium]|nr:beta-N-acetylhexosaminidase [Clostridiales bacterium]